MDPCPAAEDLFSLYDSQRSGRVALAELLLGLASYAPGAAVAARGGRLAERVRLCFVLLDTDAAGGGLDRSRLVRLLRGSLFAGADREVTRKAETILESADADARAGGGTGGGAATAGGFVSLEGFLRVMQRFPKLAFAYGGGA